MTELFVSRSKKESMLDTSKLDKYDVATKYYAEQVYNLLKKKYDVVAYSENKFYIKGLKKDISDLLNKQIKLRPDAKDYYSDVVFKYDDTLSKLNSSNIKFYLFNEIER